MAMSKEKIEISRQKIKEYEEAPYKVSSGRKKCSFKNSRGHATVDVYPDGVNLKADSGYSYNDIELTLKDLRRIRECILS